MASGTHTSKKALTACFDVWSGMYAGTDLVFKQVMLGPVHTAIYTMDDKLPGWMVRLKEPLFRIARRHGPRDFALCAHPQEEADLLRCELSPRSVRCGSVNDSFPVSSRGRKTLDGRPRRHQPDADRDSSR